MQVIGSNLNLVSMKFSKWNQIAKIAKRKLIFPVLQCCGPLWKLSMNIWRNSKRQCDYIMADHAPILHSVDTQLANLVELGTLTNPQYSRWPPAVYCSSMFNEPHPGLQFDTSTFNWMRLGRRSSIFQVLDFNRGCSMVVTGGTTWGKTFTTTFLLLVSGKKFLGNWVCWRIISATAADEEVHWVWNMKGVTIVHYQRNKWFHTGLWYILTHWQCGFHLLLYITRVWHVDCTQENQRHFT